MKEFFVSAKYKMKIPDGVEGVHGAVILPSGVERHVVERRNLGRHVHLTRRLVDPQLYLVGLNANRCRKACANLASWGWFPLRQNPTYSSAKFTQAEWRRQMRDTIVDTWVGELPSDERGVKRLIDDCLRAQSSLAVEALILPAPLTSDPNTTFGLELEWLERGAKASEELKLGLPVFATVALSDVVLRGVEPGKNRFLDLVVDQVTAREMRNVYLVVEQASEDGYYCSHPNTVGSLLRLCSQLKQGGVERIMVAFAGIAGLLTLAAGATAWTSGWYRSERRLRMADFEMDEGRAFPAYYSQGIAGEIHVERDLDSLVRSGLWPRLRDPTSGSAGLCRALDSGQSVSAVPEWQHRASNVRTAIQHYLCACVRETARLSQLSHDEMRLAVDEWLSEATALAREAYSSRRREPPATAGPPEVAAFNPRTSLDHQASWLRAFQEYSASERPNTTS